MKKRSPEVNAYIANAEPFAQPILRRIRTLYHKAHPQVVETIKWGFPNFEYKGMLGSMAAFRHHVDFGFWKGSLIEDRHGLFGETGSPRMSAIKVKALSGLPPEDVLLWYIREAMRLNEEGVKLPRPARKSAAKVVVPEYFDAALDGNRKARTAFDAMSPSHRREYVEWISEAKQEATRERRMATALEWLEEGKSRNWKYERKS